MLWDDEFGEAKNQEGPKEGKILQRLKLASEKLLDVHFSGSQCDNIIVKLN
jgi:hypothetical protein